MTERDNEKELILGNSQLISLFFVVVALCGVFFALGYMIGRNSNHAVVAGMEGNAAAVTTPVPGERDAPRPSGDSARSIPPDSQPATSDATTPPLIQTQPAQELPVPKAEKEPVVAERTQSKPVPAAPPAPAPKPAAAELQPMEAGATYLQVAALRHDDAAKLVKTLREQDLPAHLAESPKPEMFRVLVGPYHQPAQVADARARLKTLGFANAFVQK